MRNRPGQKPTITSPPGHFDMPHLMLNRASITNKLREIN
jgi:hypothetical protein